MYLDAILDKVYITDLKPYLYLVEGHPVESIARLIIDRGIDLLWLWVLYVAQVSLVSLSVIQPGYLIRRIVRCCP